MIKKICVLQLLRTGDLIQTCQAISSYNADFKNFELTLVARKKFAEPIEFLLKKYFHKIIYIDTAELDVSNFIASKDLIFSQIKILRETSFDLLLNFSFSTSSEYLAGIINSKNKVGLSRNSQGKIVSNDTWSQYIFSTVMNGNLNPFNLVDLFSFMIGGKTPSLPVNTKIKRKTIFIHPFSSHEKKRWTSDKWSQSLLELVTTHSSYNFFIVGSLAERNEASKIINHESLIKFSDRIFNLAGEPLEEIYDELSHSSLFIGHDSMVGHLASMASVPTLTISLGMVRPNETTPYGKHSINLAPRISCFPCNVNTKCENLPCHNEITANAISEFSLSMLNNSINEKFLMDFTNKFACVCYFPNQQSQLQILTKYSKQDNLEDTFKSFYSLIWSYYFRNENLNLSFPNLSQTQNEDLKNYLIGIQNLYELYNFAQKFTSTILIDLDEGKVTPEIYKSYIHRLGEVDQLAQINKNAFPLLSPIIDYFHVHRMNIPGNTVTEMLNNTLVSYKDAESLTAVIYDLVEKTLLNAQIPLDNKTNNV